MFYIFEYFTVMNITGQLIAASKDCKSCSKQLLKVIQGLENRLSDTSSKALPYVEQSDEAYFKRFLMTIDQPYLLNYQQYNFDQSELASVKVGTNSKYDENKGDDCYAKMMGTYIEKDNT